MAELLTEEQFKIALPKQVRGVVNSNIIDTINSLIQSTELCQNYRENILSYTSVISQGKYKLTDYLNAVAYVSHKLLGSTNVVAYAKTFPDRYQRLLDKDSSIKDISSYVAAYNKTKLVNLIMEQTLVPTHVLFLDLNHQSLQVLAHEMVTAKADMARVTAASKLYEATKVPETTKIKLDLGIKENTSIQDLKATIAELAIKERLAIESGIRTVKEVAYSEIVAEKIIE